MLVNVVLPQPIFPATAICIISKLTSLMLLACSASVLCGYAALFWFAALRYSNEQRANGTYNITTPKAYNVQRTYNGFVPKLKVLSTKKSKQLRIYFIYYLAKILWVTLKIHSVALYYQHPTLVLLKDKLLISFIQIS